MADIADKVDIIIKTNLKTEVIMPGGNRMGPEGLGRMTGRKMGLCVGNDQPGFTTAQGGTGQGFGRGNRGDFGRSINRGGGFGMRFRNWFGRKPGGGNADVSPKNSGS